MTTTTGAQAPDPMRAGTATDIGSNATAESEESLIRTEIPGTVLEVTVVVGDRVQAGGVVALLESMKMEIPVIAEAAGTVTRVAVAEGDTVQLGDVIAVSPADGPGADPWTPTGGRVD
jgi:biotin carboxyl carrier protein